MGQQLCQEVVDIGMRRWAQRGHAAPEFGWIQQVEHLAFPPPGALQMIGQLVDEGVPRRSECLCIERIGGVLGGHRLRA